MKIISVIVFLAIVLLGCSKKQELIKTSDEPANRLQGKWALISSKQEPNTSHQQTADSIAYFKVLTRNTFTWVAYEKNSGVLISTAGGEYHLEGEKYTENIQYIFPYNASLMSSGIPFRCQLNEDNWIHSGYIENREYDSLINDYVVLSKNNL